MGTNNIYSMENIISQIKAGQNPQQITINLLTNQMQNTPIGVNLLNLAKQNRTAEIEQIARNLMAQQGRDYDKEFNAFKQKFGF